MPKRSVTVSVARLGDPSDRPPAAATPAERLASMWQLALDAWAFKGDSDAQSRLPRHVVRVVRRVEIELEGMRVPVLGRGELLANKKALARPQDLADVQALEREPKR